ncbi:MAG: MoaD/ThiS family protein [Planctomycetota bacterium]|jgi:molybdopterin converting factor subunit 1|nr:MoaD/ThiS family protein [Planctomycetota bacterium]
MRVRIRIFASAREILGKDDLELELPDDASVATLRETMALEFPALKRSLSSCRFAVDLEFAPENTPLSTDSDIALIPPVSGGSSSP